MATVTPLDLKSYSETLKYAELYASKGWRVLPVHSLRNGACTCRKGARCEHPGKHPRITDWPNKATTDIETTKTWWQKWPLSNIGIATGAESGIFCLDIDPDKGGLESLQELKDKHGKLPDTVEAITGGGGRHLIFKYPGFHINNSVEGIAPGIDVRGDGGQFVVEPSIHPSGNRYLWEVSSHPEDMEPAAAPSWLLELIKKAQNESHQGVVIEEGDTIPEGQRNNTLHKLACTLRRYGSTEQEIITALEVTNERCSPPLTSKEIKGIAKSAAKHTPEHVKQLARIAEEFGDEETDVSWMDKLKMVTKGDKLVIANTIDNALIIMESDPLLKEKMAFNEFSYREVITGRLPWGAEKGDWRDSDDAGLRHYLEKCYGITGVNKIDDARTIVFKQNAFHTVRNYFKSIKGKYSKSRIDTLPIDYLGAEDSKYTRLVFRKQMVAAVARVMEPGIKKDEVLIFAGAQGIGKSTFIKILGGEWFSDSLTTVIGKEAYEQLQGNWLIEIGELNATRKADIEAVKMFLSKSEDIYRPAYGKRTVHHPRQCVFFGTTNEAEFLRDATGDRRYWPIKCGVNKPTKDIFTDLAKERDEIWAEAYDLYLSGESLHLSREEELEAQREREAFKEENPKKGIIVEFLEKPLPPNWYQMSLWQRRAALDGDSLTNPGEFTIQRGKVCAMEIWCECFRKEAGDLTPIKTREINDILSSLEGWKMNKHSLSFGEYYGKRRGFVRLQTS